MTGSRNVAAALIAAAVSTALHASGLVALAPSSGVRLQGGAASMPARLGDGFADLAAGTMAPVGQGATALHAPVAVADLTVPVAPMVAPIAESLPAVAQTGPVAPPSASSPSKAPVAPAPDLSVTAPAAPTGVALAPVGETAPDPTVSPDPSPVASAVPVTTVEPAAAPVPDRVLASEPATLADRPRARPNPPEKSRAKADTPKAKSAPALVQGNSDQNDRRGASTGKDEAGGTTAQGAGTVASPAGNGAVENYGGKVMRRILKTRKVRAPAKGVAVVGFAIAPDGRLASLRLLRSSGSPALDEVALDHLRRAQPFPKPPPGLKRDWSFEFAGQD